MSPNTKSGRILIILVPLLSLGTILFGWLGSHTHRAVVEEDSLIVHPDEMSAQVKVIQVRRGELPFSFKAMGEVVTLRQFPTSVVSWISGFVTAVEVVEGQEVAAGRILVRLDDRLAQNALSRAQSVLAAAEAELRGADQGGLDMEQSNLDLVAKQMESSALVASQEAGRLATLLPRGATSQKEAIVALKQNEELTREAKSATEKANLFRSSGRELKRALLLSAVQKAKADVADAEINLDSTLLRAPLSGRITGLRASTGMAVNTGTGIVQVQGKGSTGLCLWVTPGNANQILPGAKVTFERDGGTDSRQGTVISVGRQLDPKTGLVPIEAALEEDADPPRLGEVIFAEVTTKENGTGLLIPDSALITQDGQSSIYRLDREYIAHHLPVRVVVRNNRATIITADNLAEGDFVITEGNYNLPNGARVVAATSP